MVWAPTDSFLNGWSGGEAPNVNIGSHYGANDPMGRTAFGGYGITTPTYAGLMRTHPELGLTMANRTDPALQRTAFAALSQDNANALGAAGVPVSDSTVRIAGMFGPATGAGLLKADPNASAEQVIQSLDPRNAQAIINGNGSMIKGKTVGQVLAGVDSSHGGSGGISGLGSPTPSGQLAPAGPGIPAPGDVPDAPAARGPSDRATVADPGPGQDGLAVGLAILGGAQNHTGFSDGSKAYQATLDRAQARSIQNANYQNDGINRDWKEPYNAYDAATARARLLEDQRRDTISGNVSANDLAQRRLQLAAETDYRNRSLTQNDDHFQQQQADHQKELDAAQGRGDVMYNPDNGATYRQTPAKKDGTITTTDATGKIIAPENVPPNLQTERVFNSGLAQNNKLLAQGAKDSNTFLSSSQGTQDHLDQIDRASQALKKATDDGVAGPDLAARALRTLLPLVGGSTAQDTANMNFGQLNLAAQRDSFKGQGAVSDNERKIFNDAAANLEKSPEGSQTMLKIARDAAERQLMARKAWQDMPYDQRSRVMSQPGGFGMWQASAYDDARKQQAANQTAKQDAAKNAATPGGNSTTPDAGSFDRRTAPQPTAQPASAPLIAPTVQAPPPMAGGPNGANTMVNPAAPPQTGNFRPLPAAAARPDLSALSPQQLADVAVHPERYPNVPVWAARQELQDRSDR